MANQVFAFHHRVTDTRFWRVVGYSDLSRRTTHLVWHGPSLFTILIIATMHCTGGSRRDGSPIVLKRPLGNVEAAPVCAAPQKACARTPKLGFRAGDRATVWPLRLPSPRAVVSAAFFFAVRCNCGGLCEFCLAMNPYLRPCIMLRAFGSLPAP